MTDNTSSYGFQNVAPEEKQGRVNHVFSRVAKDYDLMNDLMSAGIHRVWKRFTIEVSAVRPGHRVLDIAGGTGDEDELGRRRRVHGRNLIHPS